VCGRKENEQICVISIQLKLFHTMQPKPSN